MRQTNKDTAEVAAVPESCRVNEKGHFVPIEMISDLDVIRDDLVKDLFERWVEANHLLRDIKKYAMDSIFAFCDLSAMEYDAPIGGKKGNLQIMSFDGKQKIRIQVHQYIVFDERLSVAKSLVDECIEEWSKGSSNEIKVLVNDAFDTDKLGNVSTAKILGLRRINIKNERWQKAMKALADCMTVTGSKSYIRIYTRVGEENRWKLIPLDMAAL